MTELVYEDEIYERIIELDRKAKAMLWQLYILSLDWDSVIGMLSDADRKEYYELMAMWDELQEDKMEMMNND